MYSLLPVRIWIEAVTGDKWPERVRLFETVAELKKRVWRRKKIPPSRQGLVFGGRALPDSIELDMLGVREDSVLKLHVMARSAGPSGKDNELLVVSDDPSDREHIRVPPGFSAQEDTSAKESSAGETEKEGDEEAGRRLARIAETSATIRTRRQRNNSQSLVNGMKVKDEVPSNQTTLDDVEDDRHDRSSGKESVLCVPSTSENGGSASEVSSGMIVCDLSNEFRKLKVRRHRHPNVQGPNRQRTRSKPRENREISSSEDNDGSVDQPSIPITLPLRRGMTRGIRALNMRSSPATSRCSTCAFKITNAFYCRCGKTLCSRHRSAQSHTCSKLRPKLQQVSD